VVAGQSEATITGQNFAPDATVQVNGISLPGVGNSTMLTAIMPIGFTSKPGALSLTVTNPDIGPIISDSFAYPATGPAALALCPSPSPTTVFAGSSFVFNVQPSEVNISGDRTLTLRNLPAGVTSMTASVPLHPTGATVHLQAASSIVEGTYDLDLNGAAGAATTKGEFNFTVSTGSPPGFFFSSAESSEVGIHIGGSNIIMYRTNVNSVGSVDYDVTPSLTGLPPGTTATFSPSVFTVGQGVTVTLTAEATAPVTQNALVTLVGTPSAATSDATTTFFADVTQPPGSLPGSRTDFVATAGTPYAAAYDSVHNVIFSSNPDWNRVDVISNATHKVVKSIPVRSPRGHSRQWQRIQTRARKYQ
jgi:hypothetical protein